MGDWQELVQAVFIGLTFSFLVAKLISTAIPFRESDPISQTPEPKPKSVSLEPCSGVSDDEAPANDEARASDDDDWEGIESTELDELFSAATAFVAAAAADRSSAKISSELQLELYGLYKIATEGPCTKAQPSILNVSARAKWNAWRRLGAMPPEEAMEKYIAIISELYPSWADASTSKKKNVDASDSGNAAKGPMGPVFSSLVHEEDSDSDLKLDAIHVCAREGEAEKLVRHIENGIPLNSRDSEGRTPLHWAVDRGHYNVVELLLSKNADVNAKDNEGQTALHYAVLCEREAIAELLVKHNADTNLKDEDGNSPNDLCSSSWTFISS